ncbi:hypothetical protein [Smaragdicoccus niigatensis]|uniref:hypothetical protein n=1 Tax=Smaragdicoccus niigatensis TaxID=359359 RepID=UPI000379C9CF|nr:hypothetical protein [Smaragdicoccus niigatensis]
MVIAKWIEPGLSAFARAAIVSAITVATLAGYRHDAVAGQPVITPIQDSPDWLLAAVEQHLQAAGFSRSTSAQYVKTTWQTAHSFVPTEGKISDATLVYLVVLHFGGNVDPELPVADGQTTTVAFDSVTHRVIAATPLESWTLDLSAIAAPQTLQPL